MLNRVITTEKGRKISLALKGNKNACGIGRKISNEAHIKGNKSWFKKGHPSPNKNKVAHWIIGEKNPRWIKDRTQLKVAERKDKDVKYIYWAREVKHRDNWKCRLLTSDCKGRLESHHILNWIDYPELRYEINNGITLCHAHHPRGRKREAELSPYLQSLVAKMK